MQRDCGQQAEAPLDVKDDGRPPVDVFLGLAVRQVAVVLAPVALGMFRTAAAEAERFPEVGQAFYAASVDQGRAWLAQVLAAAAERGEIACDDPDLAAHRFFALCEANLF